MKKFFAEFKKFITRGNVLDMAVGVIVGGAFTAIVNSLSNNILKPVINYLLALIFGADSLSEVFTFLKRVELVNEEGVVEIDLANSIYIDWGAFINAIINFLIIAFVLFCIVKTINKLNEESKELAAKKLTREQKKEIRAAGIKLRDRDAVEAFLAEKAAKKAEEEKAAAEKAKAEAEEKARKEREANPTAEDLLKKIIVILENNNAPAAEAEAEPAPETKAENA